MNTSLLNFAILSLYKEKAKHLLTFTVFSFIIFIVSSVIFISSSIKNDLNILVESEPDIIVQNQKAGGFFALNDEWISQLEGIRGVEVIKGRVVGRYYFEPNDCYFTIVGVDFFDTQIEKYLSKIIENMDLREFIKQDSMIIGSGVKEVVEKFYYKDSFNFILPNHSFKEVKIFKSLNKQSSIIANDLMIVNIDLAREILGFSEEEFSDLALKVPNENEIFNIVAKIRETFPNSKVTTKEDIKKFYENIINYRGGFFITLYIVVFLAFFILIFQRIDSINSYEKKELGVLRAIGWSINDIIKLKMIENLLITSFAYLIGVILAFVFVFILNAPLLANIFFDFSNIDIEIIYNSNIALSTYFLIFLFSVVPYVGVSIIPSWRASIVDINEVMK